MRDPLAAWLLLAACHPTAMVVTEVPVWEIYDGDEPVLTVRGEPGPITSTAPPPADGRVTTHPFLSAVAHDAGYEAQLKALLDASRDVPDFLARLRAAGFRVERAR